MAFPAAAQAEGKYLGFLWPKPHKYTAQDFRPYNQDPLLHQNRQWDSDGWSPQNWVNGGKSVEDVIDGFYENGLLVKQDVNCDNIPTLKVGEKFLHLSYREQNRIATFMDYAYGLTSGAGGGNGMYYLAYRRRADVIGVYTPLGLQIH